MNLYRENGCSGLFVLQDLIAVDAHVLIAFRQGAGGKRQVLADHNTRVQLNLAFFAKPRMITMRAANCVLVVCHWVHSNMVGLYVQVTTVL